MLPACSSFLDMFYDLLRSFELDVGSQPPAFKSLTEPDEGTALGLAAKTLTEESTILVSGLPVGRC